MPQSGPHAELIKTLSRDSEFPERSIRHWLATKRKPLNPIMARASTKALAAARAKLAKAAP